MGWRVVRAWYVEGAGTVHLLVGREAVDGQRGFYDRERRFDWPDSEPIFYNADGSRKAPRQIVNAMKADARAQVEAEPDDTETAMPGTGEVL